MSFVVRRVVIVSATVIHNRTCATAFARAASASVPAMALGA